MVTREELKGHWNEVKGRLKENWGQLTEDDLRQVEGGADRLVGVIQQKTGATRNEIEKFIERVMSDAGTVSNLSREYAEQAWDAMRDGYYAAGRRTSDWSHQLGRTVARRPIESILIAAAVGVVAGCAYAVTRKR